MKNSNVNALSIKQLRKSPVFDPNEASKSKNKHDARTKKTNRVAKVVESVKGGIKTSVVRH